MRFQAQRGTQDVLPSDSTKWLLLESSFRKLASQYGYQEIRTPTFEDTDLFVRSAGDTSDIVSKQMYTFTDKGDRSITLKPEGTAPAIRALIEHNLCPHGSICRLSYVTPIFRYERPQKGRLREAHQFGLELVGTSSPLADAEIIEVTVRFYESIGIPSVEASINSLGREECRTRFREAVLQHAASFLKDQPEDFRARAEKNPLRLLDSKDPAAQEALAGLPPVTDFLEEDSKRRFCRLQELLDHAGVPYRVSPEIVRGLDYYTETVFEVQSTMLGAQSALCGGGRYDNLIKDLGGPSTPSVGVGMGIERAIIVLEQAEKAWPSAEPDAFVISAGESTTMEALSIARDLRGAGLAVVIDPDMRSMKAQLRQADRANARYALIVGDDEQSRGVVQVRDLRASQQVEIPRGQVAAWIQEQA